MKPGLVLGEKIDLVVRSATGPADVDAAQHLRYRVFYEELAAIPDAEAAATRRDADRFDALCDHLLVVNRAASTDPDPIMVADGELVGCYRLLRQEVAERTGGFYTASEYNIAPLIAARPHFRFLELGRSCVLKPYRIRPVVELLWQGIWSYIKAFDIDVLFGCASLEGTDPEALALPLSYMHYYHSAPPEWHVRALEDRYVDMAMLSHDQADPRAALKTMAPLIKGYLRLGCYIGDGAVIDPQFNTTDVLILLPTSRISERYQKHFISREIETP